MINVSRNRRSPRYGTLKSDPRYQAAGEDSIRAIAVSWAARHPDINGIAVRQKRKA